MMLDWCLSKLNKHIRMVSLRSLSSSTHNALTHYCKLPDLWIRRLPNACQNLQAFNSNLEISYRPLNFKQRASFFKRESLVTITHKQLTVIQTSLCITILVDTSARHSSTCREPSIFLRLQVVKIIQTSPQSTSTLVLCTKILNISKLLSIASLRVYTETLMFLVRITFKWPVAIKQLHMPTSNLMISERHLITKRKPTRS